MQIYRKSRNLVISLPARSKSVDSPQLGRRLARSLAIAAHDPDLVALHCLARILHLERNILDQESPDLVAEPVGIQMTLHCVSPASPPIPSMPLHTLNVNLAFTLLSNTSHVARSKFDRIFMASCGSMRLELMRSSKVSVSAMPMLRANC